MHRRHLLAACAAPWLAGCAWLTGEAPDRIVDSASGRALGADELLQALRSADYVLLGELHDNPWHHRRRAGLLAALGAASPVVAEHLTRGQTVRFGPDLLASLVAAGFEAKGWDWPLHEPLFAAAAASGAPLTGGNAPRDVVRQVARSGRSAVPADLAAALDAAPLAPAAQAALDADLVQGHCGHLQGARLEGMRWAQRTRDAAMWLALQQARGATARAPAVLLAGNGHVRLDYGVPQIARAAAPAARIVSVGFAEAGGREDAALYTHLWTTPRVDRDDPCRGMQLPPAR